MVSGLAHLLPSLEQRCPGLLEPQRTLEAAARQGDLAGLQVAWGLLRLRLPEALPSKRLRFVYRRALSCCGWDCCPRRNCQDGVGPRAGPGPGCKSHQRRGSECCCRVR